VTEGIRRFKVLDPQLAAGSLPTEAGWKFLGEEKGYKTVIDLRPRDEARPGDDAQAHSLGLRYIILPVEASRIDRALLDRFESEIASEGTRPLYVFDTDGTRPAILWYLHQVLIEQRDEASSAREVEELGPIPSAYWVAANALIEAEQKKASASATPTPSLEAVPPLPTTPPTTPELSPVVEPPTTSGAAPTATTPTPTTIPVEPAALVVEPIIKPLVLPFAPPSHLTPEQDAEAFASKATDPSAWQSFAALAVTGLGMRLAYSSQRLVRDHLHWPRFTGRASLPAPQRGSKALPSSSDA
jgi:protein tyrosine phosphatase (PTP) superfamily phosphohydrolase (DUF442 family)